MQNALHHNESGRGKIAVFLMLLAVVLYLFPETTLRPFGKLLYVSDAPEKADAIIVLLGGDAPDRVLMAEELYHRGWAPKVMFGSGFVDQEIFSKAPKTLYWETAGVDLKKSLNSLNIPEQDLLMVDSSSGFDTSGELTLISQEAEKMGFRRVILVTSATHSRRVSLIWSRVSPNIFAITIGAPDPRLENWWKYGKVIRSLGYEYAALVKEFIRRLIP